MKKFFAVFIAILLAMIVGGAIQPATALVTIPEGATIDSATLYLYGSSTSTLNAHQVNEEWTETGVTWNTRPDYNPDTIDSFVTNGDGWRSANVTDLVQEWLDGTPNYGFYLEQGTSTYSTYPSSDHADISIRPMLEIVYYTTDPADTTTVTIQRPGSEQEDVADAYIWQNHPDYNGGTSDTLYVGLIGDYLKESLLQFNFETIIEEKASLGDFVWLDLNENGIQDDGDTGFPDIEVNLFDCSNNLIGTTITDSNGQYLFNNLTPGCYVVQFEKPAGYEFSPKNSGSDSAIDSDTLPSGATDQISLESGENDLTWDAGLITITTSEIGDFVWEDLNVNGTQDAGEPGIARANVNLYDCADNLIMTETTDANGFYLFSNLPAGDYYLVFGAPEGYLPSPKDVGSDDTDSDADLTTGKTDCTTLDLNESDRTWDAGFYRLASMGDLVWQDTNSNGVQDSEEPGIAGLTVNLYNCEDNLIATSTTDENGNYLFYDLIPGDYYVVFETPFGYIFSPQDAGTDDIDSDAAESTGETICTTLISGENDMTWDAGFLSGFCTLTVTKSCYVPTPPPSSEFECNKPIDSLTMIWGGNQNIRIRAWKGNAGSTLLADIDNIIPGQAVTVSGYAGSGNDVFWEIFEADSNNKIGESNFHMSCSDADMNGAEDCGKNQGNGKGDSKGKKGKKDKGKDNTGNNSLINDWILAGMVDDESSFNCLTTDSESDPVSECVVPASSQSECDGKLKALVLKYVGGDCSATTNLQAGKLQCNGDAGLNESVQIIITRDADKVSVVPGGESITIGDEFAIVADSELKAETMFNIVRDGAVLQSLNIHTSCSKPLRLGDRFGSVEVVALDMKDGDYLSSGSDVEFTYVITNEGRVPVENITVVDSVLGAVPGSPIASLQPGESMTLEITELMTETTTNSVEVNGVTALGEECSATASSTITFVAPTRYNEDDKKEKKSKKDKKGKKK